MHHLLLTCPFSRQIWFEVLAWLQMPCRPPDGEASLNHWWLAAKRITPKPLRKDLATATLLTAWMIWKQRNSGVFDGASPSIPQLVARIREEAALWVRAGATGLGTITHRTWDVH
uniref:Uncharacterized protein n=1 Tax=Avena sativa TaxID=4498 RepID=A0ACD6AIZ6_AVESA